MPTGRPTIMTLIGGSSSLNASASTLWNTDLTVSPVAITVASVVNSTAVAPNYSIWVTNDDTAKVVTASSSSGTVFFNASTGFGSSVTWFSSLAATNSTNSLYSITIPFKYLTIVASAGSTNQTITTTIVQAG